MQRHIRIVMGSIAEKRLATRVQRPIRKPRRPSRYPQKRTEWLTCVITLSSGAARLPKIVPSPRFGPISNLQHCHSLTTGLTCSLTGELTTLGLIGLSSKCVFQSLDRGELSPPFQFSAEHCTNVESSGHPEKCSFLWCIALLHSSSELSYQDVK